MNMPAHTDCEEADIILALEDVSKVYSGIVALKQVTLEVRKGAVTVLVGENGAGKSTLMKIIAGVELPTSGQLILDGNPIQIKSTNDATACGIGMVYQELNLFGNLTVAENIFATREIKRKLRGIDHKEQERQASEILSRLQTNIRADAMVDDLRIGEQQLVEIAKAVAQNTRILLMDEPTSALSSTEVDVLFKVINDLKAQGVAVIYVSHRLEELIRIGDYITVLRDGQVTGNAKVPDINIKWIVRQMIGSDAKDFSTPGTHVKGRPVLQLTDISLPRATGGYLVDHVSLTVKAGEIVGLYGLMGAGRSELFDCIMGRYANASGDVVIDGNLSRSKSTNQRIKQGVVLIPEDRQREGLVPILSIGANLTLSSLSRFLRFIHISTSLESAAIQKSIQSLSIKAPDPTLDVTSLSGGNQQKVVIGKALMTDPKVLLMDEPSRGIDVGAKADVFRTMRELAADGLGILFATSDLDEVMALSDRIAVMSNGILTGIFERNDVTEAVIVTASTQGHADTISQSGTQR